MRIGQVADVLGVSRDTIRRLERAGVIAPQRDWAGHRRFNPADLERLRVALFERPASLAGTESDD
jgi:excisionase family DNA binding protein